MHFTRKKEIILGAISWVVGPIMELVYAFMHCKSTNGQCVFIKQKFTSITRVLLFSWNFFIPCCIMMFCFIRICIKLYRQDVKAGHLKEHTPIEVYNLSSNVSITQNSTITEENPSAGKRSIIRNSSEHHRGHNVTKTCFLIFLMYLICWTPNQFLFLQYNLDGYFPLKTTEYYISNTMVIFNSVCNPFVYALHMKQYREKVLPCW